MSRRVKFIDRKEISGCLGAGKGGRNGEWQQTNTRDLSELMKYPKIRCDKFICDDRKKSNYEMWTHNVKYIYIYVLLFKCTAESPMLLFLKSVSIRRNFRKMYGEEIVWQKKFF